MIVALGYARRSKETQDNTVSLDEQCQRIEQHCQSQGYELTGIIKHNGVSGTKRRRFDELLKEIDRARCTVLVIYHLDRLARDNVGLATFLTALRKRNVTLFEIAGAGRIDTSKATGKLTTTVRGVFDEYYAEVIGEKTRDALRHCKEQGRRYSNIPPFGYRHVDQRLVEHPEEQRALALFREAKALGLGISKAVRFVRSTGYQGRLSRTVVRRAYSAF
jgi:site-specific DNA recombinase